MKSRIQTLMATLATALLFSGCTLPLSTPAQQTETISATPTEIGVEAPEEPKVVVGAEGTYSLFPAGELVFACDREFTDESEEVVLSPDDLLEQLSLTGRDQLPPDQEGVTTVHEEVEVTYDIPMVDNDKVQYFINYYTGRGKKIFTRWLERSARYIPEIQRIFAEEGLPADLAYLAMIESGFNPKAYSWAHAAGPWQFIESTGKIFGLKNTWWYDERRDIDKATHAAAAYLKRLGQRFNHNWYLAIAAYNAGPGKINRAIKKYNTTDFWEMSRGSYLKQETKYYVPKLLAALQLAKEPEKFGFTDLNYQTPLAYNTVTIPSATDLEVVAKLTGSTYEEIKELNQELKRWCTPPDVKDYQLRIPVGTLQQFTEGYAALSPADRANYLRHTIKSGDTLQALAKRYGIRIDDIVSLNNIKNPRALKIGTNLILPLKKGGSNRPIESLEDDYIKTRRDIYTVRNGDSLWSISQRFGVTEYQLRVWNRLGWSNVIRPGQTLYVSEKGAGKTKTSSVKPANSSLRELRYTVREGDTIWDISRRHRVAADDIYRWNGINRNHILRPGDTLTLHVPADAKA